MAGLVMAGALLGSPTSWGATSDDIYLQAYRQIQEGDQLISAGRSEMARTAYEEAEASLRRLQSISPNYSPNAVNYRLKLVQQKLAAIPAQKPEPKAPVRPAETVEGLKQQVLELQKENQLLQAKLREALGPRPAAIDPQELEKARNEMRELQKEKDLLRAEVEKAQASQPEALDRALLEQLKGELAATKEKLVQSVAEVATLTRELQSARNAGAGQPDATKELAELRAALKQEAARAEELQQKIEEEQKAWAKTRAELEEKLNAKGGDEGGGGNRTKDLEKERDDLMKKLNEANRELYDVKARGQLAQFDTLTNQVANLRARLEVFEARKVPYTPEELALMEKSTPKLATSTSRSGRTGVKELPAGAGGLVAEAEAAFARKRFAEAEAKYQEVLKMDENNPVTLANLAAIQLEQEKVLDAEQNLEKARKMNPEDAYVLSLLGMVRFRQQKFDDALDLLSQAAQLDPTNPETQNYLGITLSQRGQREPAETALRKAVQLAPNYAGAHHNLAVIYASQKPPFLELARFHYNKALALGQSPNAELEAELKAK